MSLTTDYFPGLPKYLVTRHPTQERAFSGTEGDNLVDIVAEACQTENRLYIVVNAIYELVNPKQMACLLKCLACAVCSVFLTGRKTHDLEALLVKSKIIAIKRSCPNDLRRYFQHRFQESHFLDIIADTSPIYEAILKRAGGLQGSPSTFYQLGTNKQMDFYSAKC